MIESVNGILLRRIRYSDTSLILTWFTDLHGKIKAMAKGALRRQSPFAGKLDLFFHCDLLLAFSRKSEIHQLREVSIRTAFERIRTGYLKTCAASYFAELVDKVSEFDHAAPEIYELLLRALDFLNRKDPDPRTVLFFESELCKPLGIYTPDTDSAADKLTEVYGRLPDSRSNLMGQF